MFFNKQSYSVSSFGDDDYSFVKELQEKNLFERKLFNVSSGLKYGATAMIQAMMPNFDADTLASSGQALEVKASALELQATQRANALRDQFNEYIGNEIYSASTRNIKTDSGSVRGKLEKSSENIGKDIQTITENASQKASAMRDKAHMLRRTESSLRDISGVNKWANVMDYGMNSYTKLAKGLS